MATEIELKAWVSDPQKLKIKLSSAAVFKGTFEKNDVYFIPVKSDGMTGGSSYGVRVRNVKTTDLQGISKKTSLVTYKSKEVREGIEVNDEREFEVSSSAAFIEFLIHLGFKERIRKRKKGSSFENNGITAELSKVQGLGWFIELEILLSKRHDKKIKNEKQRLLRFLDRLEISRTSIESRSYSSLLAEI